jgi:hypothetical protein
MRKYRDDIPDTAHFLPLPMESDDIHLAGPDADVATAFNLIRKGLADMHLTLSYGAEKTCC